MKQQESQWQQALARQPEKGKQEKAPRRVRTPEVLQVEACECGAACLQIVLRFYHCFLPMEEVREACNVSRDGCSAADIVTAAQHFGLVAKGKKTSLEKLRSMSTPCILHWKFNHFVVLEGIRRDKVYLNDPAIGRRCVTWQELDEAYTGIVLTFAPGENFQTNAGEHSMAAILGRTLHSEFTSFAFLFATGLLLIVPGLVGPVLTQIFIDEVLLRSNASWLLVILAAMGLSTLVQALLSWNQSKVLSRLQRKLIMFTDVRLVRHMLRLPIAYYEQRYAGELSQRAESNHEIYTFAAGALSQALLNTFQAVFYLIFLLFISPVLTAVGVAGVVINLLITLTTRRGLSELAVRQQQDQNHLTGILCAGLSVFSTIKANGAENDYAADIISRFAKTTKSEQEQGSMQQVLNAVPAAITGVFNVVILLVGVRLVIRGQFTAGMLTAFMQILVSFTSPVNQLIGFARSILALRGNVNRVEDSLSAREDDRFAGEKDAAMEDHFLTGELELRQVVFGYNMGHEPLIRGISMKIAPGSVVALVGKSGCGKSTIGMLIAGLLTPWEGEVVYDGVPLPRIPVDTLNASVAVIGQNTMFIAGSIRDNLLFWNRNYKDEDLTEALKDADALKLIEKLPGGLDFHLEEDGRNLSGGQRQQLEICRALMRNPSVLIMDEATSALDAVTEANIIHNLSERSCTCFMIAHRLSTVRNCDMILVVDQGRIAEAGTHEELMARGGLYCRLEEN